ncbi:LPS assembly lipoprotein LptE [Nitrospina gracilis]|uniref:LPS assembly lipoprotein LptE n=1 Tax=Nitrospina gracilis TaxID=35801 RepID=UPI001EFFEB99|nr:LptE family protein [Nitrospina gracilis]MCF8721763.1 outer membrane lipopolysaccharide assembly protein LptE/RlpB [Nitrospina gracilis Nb-211]
MTLRSVFSLLLFSLLTACGYQLAGTGAAQLPPHLKTIAIPVFDNVSQEPTINRSLTERVRQSFLRDGRLKLVTDSANADLVLNGKLTGYSIRAVAFDDRDVVTEYWVYIDLDVVVKDQVKNRTHLKQTLKTRWDYRPSINVVDAEASRQEAFLQAYRLLGNRLVSLIIDQF